MADTQLYRRLCPSVCPLVRRSIHRVEKWKNERFRFFLCMIVCGVGIWVQMGVGCPCSPIRNNIVTPRHLLVCGGRGSLLWLGRGCDANFGQFRVMQNFHNGSFFLPLDLQTHPLFYYLHKKIFLPEKHQIWMSAASKGIRLRRPDWSYFKGLF